MVHEYRSIVAFSFLLAHYLILPLPTFSVFFDPFYNDLRGKPRGITPPMVKIQHFFIKTFFIYYFFWQFHCHGGLAGQAQGLFCDNPWNPRIQPSPICYSFKIIGNVRLRRTGASFPLNSFTRSIIFQASPMYIKQGFGEVVASADWRNSPSH